MIIESTSNSKFKLWRSLLSSKGLKSCELALVSGKRLVEETVLRRPATIECVIQKETHERVSQIPANYKLSSSLFKEIDVFGTDSPILVVQRPDVTEFSAENSRDESVLFVPCGNPRNLGAIIRSAAGFGIDRIVLLPSSAHPFLPEVTRAAAANNFSISIQFCQEIDSTLGKIYALDLNGAPLQAAKLPKNMKLISGEEGLGLSRFNNTKINRLTIDLADTCESLNVAVATGIALFHWSMQKT